MTNPESRLASFFGKYDPAIARLGKALRAKLRARLPGLSEVVYVYANQGSLVIAYSPSGKGYDAPCTLAVEPDCVKLYFAHGPELSKSDAGKQLQGSGKAVRYVVLGTAADFDREEVQALLSAALKLSKVRPDASAKGSLILKAESQKRRAAKARR